MLIIRNTQMRALEEAGEAAFEQELIRHSQDFAPELCRVAGEANLREAVQKGLRAARGYGFTRRGPLRFYIEMLLSFGSGMDTDPQLPWIRKELEYRGAGEMTRASCLFNRSKEFFACVMGPDDQYALQALRHATTARQEQYAGLDLDEILTAAFPQKKAYIGATATQALGNKARSLALRLGLKRDDHQALLAVLMFAFGHGVFSDPLYAWVGGTLRDTAVASMEDRVERLRNRTRLYAQYAYRNLTQPSAERA